MVRVFFTKTEQLDNGGQEFEDFEANNTIVGASGELNLNRVIARMVSDNPQILNSPKHIEFSPPELVETIAAYRWRRVRNLEIGTPGQLDARPALEAVN